MNTGISKSDLVALLSGDVTAQALAERHGVSIEQVESWKKVFLLGLAAGAEAPVVRRPLRPRALVAAAAVLATAAFAQLTVFQANSPANAAEVNGNFTQLKTWLENKVGTTASNDVIVGTANKVSFGASTRQMLDLFNAEYGIGVQNSTHYARSGSAFAWYAGGTHNTTQFNSGGGTELMRLTSGSKLGLGNRWALGAHEDQLTTVRGTYTPSSTSTLGAGYSVTRVTGGCFDVTFTRPFGGAPTVVCSANHPTVGAPTGGVAKCLVSHPQNVSASTFRVFITDGGENAQDWAFSFIAVGPTPTTPTTLP